MYDDDEAMMPVTARFELKLQDLWIGVYWRRREHQIDIWLCLLPCVPLHITWLSRNASSHCR